MRTLKITFLAAALLAGALALCSCSGGRHADSADRLYQLGIAPIARKPWRFHGENGYELDPPHYQIHTTVDSVLEQHLFCRTLEAAYARFKRLVPMAIEPAPLKCYIFQSRSQWNRFTKRTMGQNASIYLDIGAGAYCQDGVMVAYNLGRMTTLSVIAHEAWHQCSWFGFRDHLPSWLEEGLATQNEGVQLRDLRVHFVPEDNYARWRALRLAIGQHRMWTLHNLTRVHAGEVVRLPQRDIDAYYAQLWSLTLFLEHSAYRPRLRRLLAAAEDGTLTRCLTGTGLTPRDISRVTQRWNAVAGPMYLHVYIAHDTRRLTRRYVAFARRLTRAWPPNLKAALAAGK